jgi:diguanylate cyclase (GGDEF)-like protein
VAAAAATARTVLSMLLPATGYLFLLRFLELPFTRPRIALASLPIPGLVLALVPGGPLRGHLPLFAGTVLFALGLELLATLWKLSRGRRPDAPGLFLATAILLLAALLESAISEGILLVPLPAGLFLGPAFLVFTALVLVAVADEREQLLLRATTDLLTGLHNRSTFLQRARRELDHSGRSGEPLALVMLDIDHFKQVNDRFGHPAGDRVLAAVAQALRETIRGVDLGGRYGGEEFIVLLVGVEEEAAVVAVERIRTAIASLSPPGVPCKVTTSAGVAIHHARFDVARMEDLIRRADAALYRAKQAGRDRTTVEETAPGPATSPADLRYR